MNIESKHKDNAELLKALGHPIRFCIVDGLLNRESNVNTIVECLDVPQPTISQHLNILKTAGIIEGRREGSKIVYYVKNDKVKGIVDAMK